MYEVLYNTLGQASIVLVIVEGLKLSLPFDSASKSFDEENPLTIALREWEKENGVLDLRDRPIDPLTLDQAKAQKKQEIIAIAAVKQEELVAGFAPPEQASWTRKVAEAKAFLASGKIEDAPMLRAEAIALSGAQREDGGQLEFNSSFRAAKNNTVILQYTQGLAAKIVTKSEAMYLDSAVIAGTRSRLLLLTEAAKSFESLTAISWN